MTIIFRVYLEIEVGYGSPATFTKKTVAILSGMEWFYRTMTVLLCYVEYRSIHSRAGFYCITTTEILANQGQLMKLIVYSQITKVTIFTIWQIVSNCSSSHEEIKIPRSLKKSKQFLNSDKLSQAISK